MAIRLFLYLIRQKTIFICSFSDVSHSIIALTNGFNLVFLADVAGIFTPLRKDELAVFLAHFWILIIILSKLNQLGFFILYRFVTNVNDFG